MDRLSDLIGKSLPVEPPQVKALKAYVNERYKTDPAVLVTKQAYILSVKSSGLAANLQHETAEIKKVCDLDKPVRIRISY